MGILQTEDDEIKAGLIASLIVLPTTAASASPLITAILRRTDHVKGD
jgi:hypothetical protein